MIAACCATVGSPRGFAAKAIAESASAKAYRVLEKMIVTLELAPGSVTTEKALIEKLSLRRTPVREAIQRLAWEGLVSVRPRAGLEIAPVTARRVLTVKEQIPGLDHAHKPIPLRQSPNVSVEDRMRNHC